MSVVFKDENVMSCSLKQHCIVFSVIRLAVMLELSSHWFCQLAISQNAEKSHSSNFTVLVLAVDDQARERIEHHLD